jgi:hypothetical protein
MRPVGELPSVERERGPVGAGAPEVEWALGLDPERCPPAQWIVQVEVHPLEVSRVSHEDVDVACHSCAVKPHRLRAVRIPAHREPGPRVGSGGLKTDAAEYEEHTNGERRHQDTV